MVLVGTAAQGWEKGKQFQMELNTVALRLMVLAEETATGANFDHLPGSRGGEKGLGIT